MADKHLSTQFDSELNALSSRVMELGGLVESQIRKAIYALAHFSEEAEKLSSATQAPSCCATYRSVCPIFGIAPR